MNRELSEECDECGYEPTIEEKRVYNGSPLAVSICPVCHCFNWMLPSEWDKEDNETLELTREWAELESIKILKEHEIYYDINFSEASELILHDENINDIRQKSIDICKILNTNKADIGKHRHGIKITFPKPYGNAPIYSFQDSKGVLVKPKENKDE